MAKEPEQLDLIDVDGPKMRAVKKQIVEYEALKDENAETAQANHQAEKAKRTKVLEEVKSADIAPDSEGAYHLVLDGRVYTLRQEAQLKITKKKAPPSENAQDTKRAAKEKAEIEGAGETEGNEPTAQRRSR